MSIRLPDPQHAYLDALYKTANESLTDLQVAAIAASEPESVVFTQDYLDEAYGSDYEERYECVMQVGGRDLDAKIRHWEKHLADPIPDDEAQGYLDCEAEMAAERRAGC